MQVALRGQSRAAVKRFNDGAEGRGSRSRAGRFAISSTRLKRLEGQARHAGIHAAGVIVATRPLDEIVPLYKQSNAGENEIVTQWDGPTCEKMGLLKMDFLGLRTLSTVERAKLLIREGLERRGDLEGGWAGRTSGKVAEWQSGKVGGAQMGEIQDVSGSWRRGRRRWIWRELVYQGNGEACRVTEMFGLTSQNRRAGGDVGGAEHLGGIRKAHSPRVPAGAAEWLDGIAERSR